MPLNTQPNLKNPDDFYEQLIDMQRDKSDSEVQLINAKLILLLANHIGDTKVLQQAMHIAAAD